MKFKILFKIILIITLLTVSTAPAQTDAAREDTLWSSGHWAPPGHFNPTHWGPSWESIFMYEVLFDFNSANEGDEIFGVIGESIAWTDNGATIEIKLRSEAKWTDGSAIDADDVVYTFWTLYAAEGYPLHTGFTKKVDSITKVDATTVEVALKSGFEYSRDIFFSFIGRWQVLPAHIWPDVIAHYGEGAYAPHVTNNWLAEDFPEALKVASGMYLPHSIAVDNSWALAARNDDWWGLGVISDDLPAPLFVGMKSFPSNFAQTTDYLSDGIDWMGGYVADMGSEIAQNDNLGTYYGQDEPHFASLSSVVEITPNHLRYPMSEHWFREMVAYSLNIQDMIDIGASGYMEQARVGRIDDRSKTLDDFYDPTVEERFGFSFDLAKAKEIRDANTVLDNGKYYTLDAPADINVTLFPDALPGTAGHNVLVDNYKISTVSGWSDFELHAAQFEKNVEELGIAITVDLPDYGGWVAQSNQMNFDFMVYGVGPGGIDRPLNHFTYFVGEAGQSVNTTGWYNPEYVDLVDQFEVAAPGSQTELDLAHDLQEILGEELPSIPLFMNGYWYSYTTKYWEGWPVDGGDLPPVAMWSFGAQGLINQVVRNLSVPGTSTPQDTPFDLGFSILSLMVLVPVVRKIRK